MHLIIFQSNSNKTLINKNITDITNIKNNLSENLKLNEINKNNISENLELVNTNIINISNNSAKILTKKHHVI